MPSRTRNQKKSPPISASQSALFERRIHDEVNEAVNSLFSRIRALDAYSKRIEETDKRIDNLLQQAFIESNRAHSTTKFLYVTSYLAAILTLLTGLYLVLFQIKNQNLYSLAAICIVGGMIAVLYLHNRNLTKNSDIWVGHLSTLTRTYLGFTHQLYQIDEAFKNLISTHMNIDPERLEEMLKQVQDITDEATEAVDHILDKMDN